MFKPIVASLAVKAFDLHYVFFLLYDKLFFIIFILSKNNKIFTLMRFLVCPDGPLEEKYATMGAGLYFVTVTVGKMVATGFLQI
jgi:cellulose synthase/poly-beta-1,6-N-acetylglucosamine synthase-like glycosyltransferase